MPTDHPLRMIKDMANRAMKELSRDFSKMYAPTGRPSIPPEKLIRALLLQVLCSIRSERSLMEQLDYNLLFRWFVGLSMDDEVWDHSTFSKNREQAQEQGLLSDEHFTVDGTLIEAWHRRRVLNRKKEGPRDRQAAGMGETRTWTIEDREGATRRMPPRQIPMHD